MQWSNQLLQLFPIIGLMSAPYELAAGLQGGILSELLARLTPSYECREL